MKKERQSNNFNRISKNFWKLFEYYKKIANRLHLDVRFLKKSNSNFQIKKRYTYQKKFIKFDIKKGEKVLDLGSGADPFPLATHLADLYVGKTSHRPGGSSVTKDKRPFIRCDIEKTPFKNKEFDFVYCSHVLEHVKNPSKACEEIMRIGKRGYIETPTIMSDILFNFTKLKNHHRWKIDFVGNTLIFIAWKPTERRNTQFNYLFDEVHSKWQNPFQLFFHKNRDLFCNMFLWNRKFKYIAINKKGIIINQNIN